MLFESLYLVWKFVCAQKLPSAFSFLVPFLHTEPSTSFMKNVQHHFQLAQLLSLVSAQHWIMPCRHTSWLALKILYVLKLLKNTSFLHRLHAFYSLPCNRCLSLSSCDLTSCDTAESCRPRSTCLNQSITQYKSNSKVWCRFLTCYETKYIIQPD